MKKYVLPGTVLVLLAIVFLGFKSVKFVGESMSPTIADGERVYVAKFFAPGRNDLVLYDQSGRMGGRVKYNIARIIGVGSDKIEFKEGQLLVNGVGQGNFETGSGSTMMDGATFQVPQGHYFVLGDNYDEVYDSRAWDTPYLYRDDVVGMVLFK